jgi:hypothetical protein
MKTFLEAVGVSGPLAIVVYVLIVPSGSPPSSSPSRSTAGRKAPGRGLLRSRVV